MKLRSPHLAAILIVVLFGGIVISMLLGVWQTESSKTPASYTAGEFAGEYNPADIRGSYSLDDIESAFEVPVGVLAEAFGIADQENQGAVQIKIFEETFGEISGKEVGTDSVRLFVSLYTARPYIAEESTGLPLRAIDLLVQDGRIDAATAADVKEKNGIELPGGAEAGEIVSATAESLSEEHEEDDTTIKGNTTFGELMGWGLTQGEIEEVIGMPIGPPNQAMRDFFIEQELEFSVYKEELQRRLDEK